MTQPRSQFKEQEILEDGFEGINALTVRLITEGTSSVPEMMLQAYRLGLQTGSEFSAVVEERLAARQRASAEQALKAVEEQ